MHFCVAVLQLRKSYQLFNLRFLLGFCFLPRSKSVKTLTFKKALDDEVCHFHFYNLECKISGSMYRNIQRNK